MASEPTWEAVKFLGEDAPRPPYQLRSVPLSNGDTLATPLPSSEIIRTRVRVPRLLAATTIRGRRLFRSRVSDCAAILFEGGVYSKKYHTALWPCTECPFLIYPSIYLLTLVHASFDVEYLHMVLPL